MKSDVIHARRSRLRRVAGGATKFRAQRSLVFGRLRARNVLPVRGCALGDPPGAPIVSLTSYGERVAISYLAIESILKGRLRPSRIILWVDDEETVEHLPAA